MAGEALGGGGVAAGVRARPAASPAPVRSVARSPRGVARSLAMAGMAMLTFNVTRIGGFTVSDLLFGASAAAVVFDLVVGRESLLAPKRYRTGSQLVLAGALLMLTFETISAF